MANNLRDIQALLQMLPQSLFSSPQGDGNAMMDLAILSARMAEEKKYMTPENKELVEYELKTWCKSDDISPNLVKLITKMWYDSRTGTFPTLDYLVEYFDKRACLCLRGYTNTERTGLIRHFLSNFGRLPVCIETQACMEFFSVEHRFPSPEELQVTIQRTIQLMQDPVAFHSNDKNHVPVPNLAHIKAVVMEDTNDMQDCALCMESVDVGQTCYRLSCSHIFHADAKQCLGDCSIIEWFSKHRQCPVCRQPVIISGVAPPDPRLETPS